jgi:hypothetical protein
MPFLSFFPLFPSQVLLELKEYATEVDVDFVRKVHIRPVILPVLVTPPVTAPVPLTITLTGPYIHECLRDTDISASCCTRINLRI